MTEAAVFPTIQFGRDTAAAPPPRAGSPTSLALENLRGVVILIVLAFQLFALVKAPVVLAGTLLFTWTSNATLARNALGARLIGLAPRPLAKFAA